MGGSGLNDQAKLVFYAQVNSEHSIFVMAGLVPAIHVFGVEAKKDVDARHKAGHDELTEGANFISRISS
jgi:hypothetical protein